MTPVIYTGPPDPEHGGNLPSALVERARRKILDECATDALCATREREGLGVHGVAVMVRGRRTLEHDPAYAVLHSSDDLAPWLAAGWRLTSY